MQQIDLDLTRQRQLVLPWLAPLSSLDQRCQQWRSKCQLKVLTVLCKEPSRPSGRVLARSPRFGSIQLNAHIYSGGCLGWKPVARLLRPNFAVYLWLQAAFGSRRYCMSTCNRLYAGVILTPSDRYTSFVGVLITANASHHGYAVQCKSFSRTIFS